MRSFTISIVTLLLLNFLALSPMMSVDCTSLRRDVDSDSSQFTIVSPIVAVDEPSPVDSSKHPTNEDEFGKTDHSKHNTNTSPSSIGSFVSRIPGAHLVPAPVSRLWQQISGGHIVLNEPLQEKQIEPKQLGLGVGAVKKTVGGVIVAKLAAPVVLKAAKVAALASLIPVKLAAKGALIGALIAKPLLIKSALIGGKAAKIASFAIGKPLFLTGGAVAAGSAIKSKLAGSKLVAGSKKIAFNSKQVTTDVPPPSSKFSNVFTPVAPIVGPTSKTNPDTQKHEQQEFQQPEPLQHEQQHEQQQDQKDLKARQLDNPVEAALRQSHPLDNQVYEMLR